MTKGIGRDETRERYIKQRGKGEIEKRREKIEKARVPHISSGLISQFLCGIPLPIPKTKIFHVEMRISVRI